MEESVAVLNPILLIVRDTAHVSLLGSPTARPHGLLQEGSVTAGQGQLVHLAVTGGADAAAQPKDRRG